MRSGVDFTPAEVPTKVEPWRYSSMATRPPGASMVGRRPPVNAASTCSDDRRCSSLPSANMAARAADGVGPTEISTSSAFGATSRSTFSLTPKTAPCTTVWRGALGLSCTKSAASSCRYRDDAIITDGAAAATTGSAVMRSADAARAAYPAPNGAGDFSRIAPRRAAPLPRRSASSVTPSGTGASHPSHCVRSLYRPSEVTSCSGSIAGSDHHPATRYDTRSDSRLVGSRSARSSWNANRSITAS